MSFFSRSRLQAVLDSRWTRLAAVLAGLYLVLGLAPTLVCPRPVILLIALESDTDGEATLNVDAGRWCSLRGSYPVRVQGGDGLRTYVRPVFLIGLKSITVQAPAGAGRWVVQRLRATTPDGREFWSSAPDIQRGQAAVFRPRFSQALLPSVQRDLWVLLILGLVIVPALVLAARWQEPRWALLSRVQARLQQLAPQWAFLVLGTAFGLGLLVVTPPFQVPDERAHFFRAFQVSEGGFMAGRNAGRVGGALPRKLVESSIRVSEGIQFNFDNKQDIDVLLAELRVPLQADDRIATRFPGSAVYSPVCYLPQAAGIVCGRMLGVSPVGLMYFGRAGNLACWLLLVFMAIRMLPFQGWALTVLALAPMSLSLGASLSADGPTMALAFLFLAWTMKCVTTTEPLTGRQMAPLAGIGILLSLTKQVFTPISFLVLLIPPARLGGTRRYAAWAAAVILPALAASALWVVLVRHLFVPGRPEVSPVEQFGFIANCPEGFLAALCRTVAGEGWHLMSAAFGSHLGWLDAPVPNALVVFLVLAWLVAALRGNERQLPVPWGWRALGGLIFAVGFLEIAVMMYLSWTPVGAGRIAGLQGRYLIPLLPFLALVAANRRWGGMGPAAKLFLTTGLGLVLFITVKVLLFRYYLLVLAAPLALPPGT